MDSIVYAYLGDAIFSLKVREYLINKGICKVNLLQKESTKYVSAKSQSKFLQTIIEELTEEELDIVKRARNYKRSNHPKNTDIITYKYSTAFEALIGYLYQNKKYDRLDFIMRKVFGEEYVCIW